MMKLSLPFLLLFSLKSFAAPTVTAQGRLFKPDGELVTGTAVTFRFQVRSPGSENCLQYEEEHVKNLSLTNGVFILSLGDGSGSRIDSTGFSLDRVFANRGTFSFTHSECSSGSTYSPALMDTRRIKIFFNDGTFAGWEEMSDQKVSLAPMAIESYQVGGHKADQLMRVADISGNPLTLPAFTQSEYTSLTGLIGGTSSLYEKVGKLNGITLPILGTGQVLGWNGTAWSAVTPFKNTDETDPTVFAFAKSVLPNCTGGEVLKSDGTVFSCVTPTTLPSGSAGGDLSGTYPNPTVANNAITAAKIANTTITDAQISATAAIADTKLAMISTAGKVSGSAIISGTIAGNTSMNTSGSVVAANVTSVTESTNNLLIYKSGNANKITFTAPAGLITDYSWVLPAALGSNGQVLSTDAGGNLSWITPAASGVTSVSSANLYLGITNPTTTPVFTLNVGTAANTVAAGNDTRIVNAVQSSASPAAGDISGSFNAGLTINANAVTTAKIADANITTAKILDANVTQTKIADSSINVPKLQLAAPITGVNRLIASDSGTGTTFAPLDGTIAGQLLVWQGATGWSPLALSGDATLSTGGAMTLKNTGTAGTYRSVTTDAQGRVTSGTNPTTIAGYGLTDALNKTGDVMTGTLGIAQLASDPAGLLLADKGKIWYNTTSGNLKYWDGSAAQPLGIAGSGLQNLNGLLGATQSFAVGTAGTNFGIVSTGGTHTFNFPDSSAVNRGLLTSADWTTFNGKLGTASTFSGDVSGTSSTMSVDKIKSTAVTITGLTSGNFLKYNGTAWVNSNIANTDVSGLGTLSTLNSASLTTNVSGVLPIANGGTNVSTAPANGQLLVGNGTGYSLATLTQGSGITITNGAGTITIASSGGASGTAGGDLSGTYPNPAVAKIQGTAVSGTAPTSAQFLVYDGAAQYAPVSMSGDASISTAGVATLKNTGTAGTYRSVTTDAQGRVTAGTNPTTISGYGLTDALNKTGDTMTGILSLGPTGVASGNGGSVKFFELAAGGTDYLAFRAPDSIAAPVTWTLPATDGTNGQVLSTNGTGTLGWSSVAGVSLSGDVSGTVSANTVDKIKGTALSITSLTSGNFLKFTGTNWVNANIANTDVSGLGTLSTLSSASLTTNVSGVLPIANGGTNASTAISALNNLLPSQATNAGKVLQTDGTNATWGTASAGTVTSVGITVPSYMTAGSAITSSGNIALGFGSQTARQAFMAPIAGGAPTFRNFNIGDVLSSGGGSFLTGTSCAAGQALIYASGTDTMSCSNITASATGSALASANIWIGNGSGVAAPLALSGDATMLNTGAVTVGKIQNRTIASTTPSLGSFLKWNNGLTQWEPYVLPNCTASDKILHYNSTTDTFTCDFTALSSNVTGTMAVANGGTGLATLTSGSLLVGNGTGNVSALAGTSTGNVLYASGASAWSSATPDTAGLADKTTTQTLSNKTLKVVQSNYFTVGATSIDWSLGNVSSTTSPCATTSYTVSNMNQGATYMFAVQSGSGHSGVCSFTDGASTFVYNPANATPTTNNVVYSMIKVGTVVYVSWIDGWQ